MLRAPEVIQIAEKAIAANYSVRNTCIIPGSSFRHQRMVAQRRRQIREWIGVLRIVRDPLNADAVAEVTNAGPLMAHDLRRRVLSLV